MRRRHHLAIAAGGRHGHRGARGLKPIPQLPVSDHEEMDSLPLTGQGERNAKKAIHSLDRDEPGDQRHQLLVVTDAELLPNTAPAAWR